MNESSVGRLKYVADKWLMHIAAYLRACCARGCAYLASETTPHVLNFGVHKLPIQFCCCFVMSWGTTRAPNACLVALLAFVAADGRWGAAPLLRDSLRHTEDRRGSDGCLIFLVRG